MLKRFSWKECIERDTKTWSKYSVFVFLFLPLSLSLMENFQKLLKIKPNVFISIFIMFPISRNRIKNCFRLSNRFLRKQVAAFFCLIDKSMLLENYSDFNNYKKKKEFL